MIAVISAVIAVLGAVFTALAGYWWQVRLRALEQRDYMTHYRDSLLWAAFDLQSRLWNILYGYEIDRIGPGKGFLTIFLIEGSARQAQYVRRSTAYLIAQYMGWAEIFRRDINFLDIGGSGRNERVMLLLSEIGHSFSYNASSGDTVFHVFRVNQRAVGELMIPSESRAGERWCIGYAEFCQKLSEEKSFSSWLEELLSYADMAARDPAATTGRAMRLQHQLIDLINFLDPGKINFPAEVRTRFNRSEIERQLTMGA